MSAEQRNVYRRKAKTPPKRGFQNVVGDKGFEPLTLWSQTRCATGLR